MAKLRLEDIQVESFVTAGALSGRGTVHARNDGADVGPVAVVFTEDQACGVVTAEDDCAYGSKPIGTCTCPTRITWVADPKCCDW